MRSLERHRDVGAYALGVLDEAEAFRFEDHLTGCPSCATHVTQFRPVARQLLLYQRATPRFVEPLTTPGPGLSERLLEAVSARHRGVRRRRLYAVAAAALFAVGGPTLAAVSGHGSSAATTMTATDPKSGVWARITAQDRVWGSRIEVTVKGRSGPHSCRLVVVGRDGTVQTVTNWTAPADDGATSTEAGAALGSAEIDHYEVRTRDGRHLVTVKSR
ncbi:zf-HC2 domain-containing protein [Streptomyces sp. NPDC001020]